tara:strand:+ start:1167 stop:1799 length:633 start_codon:yes stop_codon:yes gene_type:complete
MMSLPNKKIFVKICGITTLEDALLAVALGSDALGFVFAPSKRQVARKSVEKIIRELPSEIMTVGVFRNADPEQVVRVVNGTGLDAAQLHGNESFSDSTFISERIPLTIKALTIDSKELPNFNEFNADFLLLDSDIPGSGRTFNWDLIGDLSKVERVLLAGGLRPENVKHGIKIVNPFGVDVSTGVEATPGHKDPRLLRLFIEAAKTNECE